MAGRGVAEPDWPTTVRAWKRDGRVQGTDGSVWLYRAVPLAPVADAPDEITGLEPGGPIIAALDELAAMTGTRISRRTAARSGYRQVHLLLVNVPRRFTPDPAAAGAAHLAAMFPDSPVQRRLLLLGVRLRDRITASGWRNAIDSAVETLVSGTVPLSDFDADYADIDQALTRSGLTTPTAEVFDLAGAWWNDGRFADTPTLPHVDHLHVFTSASAAHAAQQAGPADCTGWPDIPGHHAVTFAAVERFDLADTLPTTAKARWVEALVDAGALAVSIRGLVEPAKITRAELRRRRRQYLQDVTERHQAGKMSDGQQEETLADLEAIENAYAQGGPPSLIDTTVLAALNGRYDDVTEVARDSAVTLNAMPYRQEAAFADTWLCSPVRAVPHLHDLPSHTVAYSGLPALSTVGDPDGALLGYTEKDRQPAYLSPTAASANDGMPIAAVFGQTGSGKDLTLDTPIPTPSGQTTMGKLRLGDSVFGRDGMPCKVTYLSPVNPHPDLFAVTLDDGQVLHANADHQWMVSTFADRVAPRKVKRRAAIRAYHRAMATHRALNDLSESTPADKLMTAREIANTVRPFAEEQFPSAWSVAAALTFIGLECRTEQRPVQRHFTTRHITNRQPVVLFPVEQLLESSLSVWRNTSGGNAVRWRDNLSTNIAAAEVILATTRPGTLCTTREIIRQLSAAGGSISKNSYHLLADVARKAGVEPVHGRQLISSEPPEKGISRIHLRVWPAREAFMALALRVAQRYSRSPSAEPAESRRTTAEMLGEGLSVAKGGQANFAIRVPERIRLPEGDLPVPPYVMGAWLGDGSTRCGQITSSTAESCQDESGRTDQANMIASLAADGFAAHPIKSNSIILSVPGLIARLREAGVAGNKHVPHSYLRASAEQRLSLLQGLMDTDGTIDKVGSCELTLCNERLASDALELIRSLGIKAAMTSSPAGYTVIDPVTGIKIRKQAGTRFRIHFTTTTRIVRLPRKAVRVPTRLRETQKWLYIKAIEPIQSRPSRCIQVDSPDRTYLAAGFVPTSNTILMLYLADQFARTGRPQVIFDPKPLSDHSAAVLASGGRVASLDELIHADGVLDPLRFAQTPDLGVEEAANMLLTVNPWGSRGGDVYSGLMKALRVGVRAGATCIGQALRTAADRGTPAVVTDPVFELAGASPLFAAMVGSDPGTPPLRVADGITLIKVGRTRLELPAPGTPRSEMTPPQRVSASLVRMITLGSMTALAERDGVMHLDEAWVVLGSGVAEMDAIGRTARSLRVLPILYTQKCTDPLRAGLAGYISRILILPIEDDQEARAACALARLEATEDRVRRITGKAKIGNAPNWDSMRALRDPATGDVLRGAVAIYCDLGGRAVPTEITIPPGFLALASTNPGDIDARRLRMGGERRVPTAAGSPNPSQPTVASGSPGTD